MLLSYVASPFFEKKHPGSSPRSRCSRTHSQQIPRFGQAYVQVQSLRFSSRLHSMCVVACTDYLSVKKSNPASAEALAREKEVIRGFSVFRSALVVMQIGWLAFAAWFLAVALFVVVSACRFVVCLVALLVCLADSSVVFVVRLVALLVCLACSSLKLLEVVDVEEYF